MTIHRLCIQSKDELSIFFTPGARHIGAMAERAEQMGRSLPISISIGVDPAIEIGSCFEAPTTPMGYDELAVAGALRGEPVRLCQCVAVRNGLLRMRNMSLRAKWCRACGYRRIKTVIRALRCRVSGLHRPGQ